MKTDRSLWHGRERLIETVVLVVLLVVAIIAAHMISPYSRPVVVDGNDSAVPGLTLNKARVIRLDGQNTRVVIIDGPSHGTEYTVDISLASAHRLIRQGDTILISRSEDGLPVPLDAYRIPALVGVAALFVFVVVLVGRRKGAGSLVGLGVSIMVILWFVVPVIVRGGDALLTCIAAAYLIAFSSILIAHGVRLRTLVSVACVAILLLFAALLSIWVVGLLSLTGSVDETAASLTVGNPSINLAAILTGGLIIASLGVLDDSVTSQVATVDELLRANKRIGRRELYKGAFSVGAEHVASLVNTLALLYAGAALPTLIVFSLGAADPFLLANSEYVVTEILHALIPGIVLVAAVPLSTFVAVRALPPLTARLRKSRQPVARYLLRDE